MSEPIIRVENLGKKYLIRHQSEGPQYTALRDVLADAVRGVGRRFWGAKQTNRPATQEEFWALKDVSFEVQPGEIVGIVGRNGAGKSTLLKILSRITEPTTGRVEMNGRVASLLEVGTGFHAELTGRENVFLNGAILGMLRVEITRKFDEIVAFAEVEKFLDTPVKRYSSGMYMRLAFAVAAHLEPEILVVDEVLAVGDAPFQKKCLGKMGEVAKRGRTVLFVSHNLAAIKTLCQLGLLLNNGRLKFFGQVHECLGQYVNSEGKVGGRAIDHVSKRHESVTVERIRVNGSEADEIHVPADSRSLAFEMSGVVHTPLRGSLQARLYDLHGLALGIFSPGFEKGEADPLAVGAFCLTHTLRLPRLNRGYYTLTFELVLPNVLAWFEARDAVRVFVEGTPMATGQTFDSQTEGWLLLDEEKMAEQTDVR